MSHDTSLRAELFLVPNELKSIEDLDCFSLAHAIAANGTLKLLGVP